jgi:hypothetical protein
MDQVETPDLVPEDAVADETATPPTPLEEGTGTQVEEDAEESGETGDMSIEQTELDGFKRFRADKRSAEKDTPQA